MKKDDDPCWKDYEQVGMKTKDGKEVPNCVPRQDEALYEALYQTILETIKKVDGKYVVYPKHGGKRLGTHDTRAAAEKQLAAIEISKQKTLEEAEYKGKKVTLNKPIRTPGKKKKFKVYVKGKKGKVKIVRFGDPNMEIKRDDPEARKSFRARHNCSDKKDKTTAGYWSCYQWRKGSKVKG